MRLAHDRGEDLVHNYGQIQARVLINSKVYIDCLKTWTYIKILIPNLKKVKIFEILKFLHSQNFQDFANFTICQTIEKFQNFTILELLVINI